MSLPENIEAIIIDVDGGVKDEKPTAEYVGKGLIMSQFPMHPIRFYKGVKGYREVKRFIKEHENEKTAYGQQKFFEIVGNTLKLDEKTLYEATKKIIKDKEIPGFSEFGKKLDKGDIKKFFSTLGYETVGHACMELFNGRGCVINPIAWSNPDGTETHGDEIVYENSQEIIGLPKIQKKSNLKGLLIPIKNSEDKRKVNEKLIETVGINKEDVAVLGNDKLEHSSMRTFGFPIASPVADQETIDLALKNDGIHIEDYMSFTRKYQPKKLL